MKKKRTLVAEIDEQVQRERLEMWWKRSKAENTATTFKTSKYFRLRCLAVHYREAEIWMWKVRSKFRSIFYRSRGKRRFSVIRNIESKHFVYSSNRWLFLGLHHHTSVEALNIRTTPGKSSRAPRRLLCIVPSHAQVRLKIGASFFFEKCFYL